MVAVNDETLAITAKINTAPIALAIIMDMASLIILFNGFRGLKNLLLTLSYYLMS